MCIENGSHVMLIYPKFYHMRPGPKGESDRDWIFRMMRHIPDNKKLIVSDEYERIYLDRGRKAANEYLHDMAKKYYEMRKSGKHHE